MKLMSSAGSNVQAQHTVSHGWERLIQRLLAFLIALWMGLALMPSAAVEVQAASDGAAAHGALHVQGTQLVDAANQPVILRGFSTHGLAWFPQYVNKESFASMKSFGANAVRLALYPHEYNGYCTGGDQTWLKNLVKTGVQAASDLDMYVLVDWHVLQDQNPNVYKEQAKAFFQEMSAAFQHRTNVLYEICNEPNGGTDWNEISRYAKEVIPIIRANDPDAVIVVGTPTWSQDLNQAAAQPLPYNNIMYSLHFYAGTHTDGLRSTLKAAHQAGLPVFVTEFGITDASGQGNLSPDQANQWMALLREYHISYMNWSFCNKNEGCSAILPQVSKTSGLTYADLSPSGQWFYQQLQQETPAVSTGGWKQSNGRWWYQNPDGSYPRSTWKQVNGAWYWFDANGWMKTGWIQWGSHWYYLKGNGAMATQTFIGQDYVNVRGEYVPNQHSGWAKEGSRWWYRFDNGSYARSQWLEINGQRYHFDEAGWMQTGWIQENNVWYYLRSDGTMAVNTVIDGYWVNEQGISYH